MRRWGVAITAFYAVVIITLLYPAALVLAGMSWHEAYGALADASVGFWLPIAILVGGQALLLLRVDQSRRKITSRSHVAVTATAMGAATALLLLGGIMSVLAAVYGDRGWPADLDEVLSTDAGFLAVVGALWAIWGVLFTVYYRRAPARMADAIGWLLKGSVLELLIAVPTHVIVRRRGDCSAPGFTAFGIATGTAVMLMCVGPTVLAMYAERRQRYRRPSEAQA